MYKKKLLLLPVLLFSSHCFAEINSLCHSGEQIVFSCSTKNNKVISVCAPPELSEHSVIQYRFGQTNNLELSYPADQTAATKAFFGRAQMFSGGGGIYLRFKKNSYDYILYNGSGKGWALKGVVVLNNSKFLSYSPCLGDATSELSPDLLQTLKILSDPEAKEFFPGDIPQAIQTSSSNNANLAPQLEEIKACYDQAVTTLQIKICANKEYSLYDDLLNKRYKTLMNLLPSNNQALLTDTQNAWLTYRQKECNLVGLQHEGGTMQPVDLIQCYITLDKQRIKKLDDFIDFFKNNPPE